MAYEGTILKLSESMGTAYSFLRVTNMSREQLREHLEGVRSLPDEPRLVVEDWLEEKGAKIDSLGGSYDDTEMSYYDYEYDYDANGIYEWNEADQIHDTGLELPDEISIQERNEYGYFNDGMYPVGEAMAVRLGMRGFEVFRLHMDNTESQIEQLSDIRYHDGLFGIKAEVWNEYVEERDVREMRLLGGTEDRYGIYQLKHNEMTDSLRFMDMAYLQAHGLEVSKGNYELEYEAPMRKGDTPSEILMRFNMERPKDFYGHSLSVSDVVVFHKEGRNKAVFVNDFGFQEVPEFFRNGMEELREQPDEIAYQLGKHYLAIQTVDDGYDYTFYDENYRELDGGIYDDPTTTMRSVLLTLVSEEDVLDHTYDNVLKESEHTKKVLVTSGMSNDGLLVETDAPIFMLRQWAFQFSEATENGTNWEYEIPGFQMNVLFDSEINEDRDVTVRDLECDITYDLNDFGEMNYEELMEKVEEANAIPIPKDVIKEYRKKTAEHFKNPQGVTADDVEAFAVAYASSVLDDYDLKGKVRDAVVIGSRSRGLETEDSDIDVVLEFSSNSLGEDELFNLLHEDGMRIGGMTLDINPITLEKSGTLEEYLPKAEAFLEEKKRLDDIFLRREQNPLTKVEEQVEENFDMIDGTLNNMPEKEPNFSKMSIHERMDYIKQKTSKEPESREKEKGGVSHDTLD